MLNQEENASKKRSQPILTLQMRTTMLSGNCALKTIHLKREVLFLFLGFNMKPSDRQGTQNSVRTYHRIVEAFKFAYAYRALLGDQDFANVTEVNRTFSSKKDKQH